jgi:hypothetical protein
MKEEFSNDRQISFLYIEEATTQIKRFGDFHNGKRSQRVYGI